MYAINEQDWAEKYYFVDARYQEAQIELDEWNKSEEAYYKAYAAEWQAVHDGWSCNDIETAAELYA